MRRMPIWIAVALAVLGCVAWFAAPWFVSDPLDELARHTPVRIWRDRNGKAVWYERTYDGEWRFPVALAEIPQEVREFTMNVEDSRFYEHGGVDYRAVVRAVAQNFGSARVLSGAQVHAGGACAEAGASAHEGRDT